MGLDISTKNDYARFNWTSSAQFIKWSNEHLGMSPFPNWDGGNGSVVVFGREPEDEREVKGDMAQVDKWIEALEKYAKSIEDDILEIGTAQLIGEIAYRTYQLGVKDTCEKNKLKDYAEDFLRIKENLIEWEYIGAIKWYFFLKSAKKGKYIFYG